MKKDEQFGFYLDLNRCIGCRTCQLSCKDYHDSAIGVNFRRVFEVEGGSWFDSDKTIKSDVFAYYTSISCNHCSDPACTKVCPTGAMMKTRYGIVMVNQQDCIGCKSCAMACPYGAPQYDKKSGHMSKCNGCLERIDENLEPICTASCPFRALEFGNISELRAKHDGLASVAPLPKEDVTLPNLVINPSKDTKFSGDRSVRMHSPEKYQGVEYDIV
ncbi:DMSO/selenate family reductase complex B subunit [Campylobacter geochelonis]|uniref:Anaerobic dimethyl sulfoxide reductase chain B n=1 Tax=Campylobacter geochelonis TaxID=1780362 RepID=A0A128EDV4_9BACT|nr:DMSO/selenate family reductase complex B subunit [Campylobacter geochelonis]QKF72121.1 anaerobic DMSO reductase DmsABC, chain B, iron-sulfur subunit [Campylobacter geochelonis]CZE45940.1 Anaerobic dimethyl sulfoxide reductase chain B [Campylobacter geochelonis]CZE46691.1 Anaerobic dimethyl sulfoxide reductase chain B [Campylobacter geochelonis]CZE49793.1 Anaerobic dimethyl sulfoxide reductase chain B [Campylobacter geochelonis]